MDPKNNNALKSAKLLEKQLYRTADAYLQVGKNPATADEISRNLVSAYRGGIGK